MPDVLLWDFGDTLVDERWMRRCPRGWPGWEDAWGRVMAEFADDWNVGAARSPEIFFRRARRLQRDDAARVEAHARDCGKRIVFESTAWRVACERRLPQALVTVNPDLFAEYVVPAYAFHVFDAIVVSFAEKTVDKPALCRAALHRLGFAGDRSRALLIDNRIDLIEAWRDIGGAGYWFQSDEHFARDVTSLLASVREAEMTTFAGEATTPCRPPDLGEIDARGCVCGRRDRRQSRQAALATDPVRLGC